jgi:hypothetical protein
VIEKDTWGKRLDDAYNEIRALKRDHLAACECIAAMHKAAWGGEARGPARGVVEDVEDLHTTCEFWKRAAEQALRLWERAQDELDDLKTPRGAE